MVKIVDENLRDYPTLGPLVREILKDVRKGSAALDCFCSISGLHKGVAIDALSGGIVSPTLKVKQLESDVFAQFDPESPKDVFLDKGIALRCDSQHTDPQFRKLVEMSLLHEVVHWAEQKFHGGIDRAVEQGWEFEKCAYSNAAAEPTPCGTGRACYALHDAGRLPHSRPPQSVMGAPFLDPGGTTWPLITVNPKARTISYLDVYGGRLGDPSYAFAARRKALGGESIASDMHNPGVDLYANISDTVVATESGTIVAILPFAEQTMAMLVRSDRGFVASYGGLLPQSWMSLTVGSRVGAGTVLAKVGATSRGVMLQFGAYTEEARVRRPWVWGGERPSELLNPTKYLLAL